jgi:hypothetical protein
VWVFGMACAFSVSCSSQPDGQERVFEPGGAGDPVLSMVQKLAAPARCDVNWLHGNGFVVADGFQKDMSPADFPSKRAGYVGDFHAEWEVRGGAALPINPTDPRAATDAPLLPLVTGIVRAVDICPAPGARLTAYATVDTTELTDPSSDATLVVYVYDENNAQVDLIVSNTIFSGNQRPLELVEVPLPESARRLVLVPMGRLGDLETKHFRYTNLVAKLSTNDDEIVLSAKDAFDKFGPSSFGDNQAVGFQEYGADWFVEPTKGWMTATFPGPNREMGAFKDFSLTGLPTGTQLSAKLFASATFTDPASLALLRVTFNDGTTLDSPWLEGRSYSDLWVRGVSTPKGATSVRVQVAVYLGPSETSSLYVDDLSLQVVRPRLLLRAAKSYSPTTWYHAQHDSMNGVALSASPRRESFVVPAELPIDSSKSVGKAVPWSLDPGNSGNHSALVTFFDVDGTKGRTVACSYRGGASTSHPTGSQVALAQRYKFTSCSGFSAGSTVQASSVKVEVQNGDSWLPSTRVAVPLYYSGSPAYLAQENLNQ